MNIKSKKSFTLVETLVVVLLSTAVFAGIYSTFIVGNKTWIHYDDSVAVKKEARKALSRMVNELREADNIRIIQNAEGSALHFHRPLIGDVSYIWNKEGDDSNRIIRHNRLGTRILAQHISRLSFKHFQNAILISITASKQTAKEKATQIVLREKVTFRSKMVLFVGAR